MLSCVDFAIMLERCLAEDASQTTCTSSLDGASLRSQAWAERSTPFHSEVDVMAFPDFFSRTAGVAIGAVLLLIVLLGVFLIGPTAIGRWFG
jgi:hypothetical protein